MESSWSVEAEILLSRVCMLLLELPRWKSVRVLDILKYVYIKTHTGTMSSYSDDKKGIKIVMQGTKDQPLIQSVQFHQHRILY